ncbi:tRNA (guanosine(37)-N1)-methyltransferase TrmD [Candidatus Wolfebacteria bacterium]|nr:tRNA (guanosine(37)-N1)-methyltransferase TrmD [Candidatus Wolfebacteria bacterium]
MKFDIITVFPEILNSYFNESILKRAQKKKLIKIKTHNLRDFTKDKHKKVDDKSYGGGVGMVLMAEPIIKAVLKVKAKKEKTKIILFSPVGKQFDNKIAFNFAKKYNHLIFICGHYEGFDARVEKALQDFGFKVQRISIGPYVLTGGELAAAVVIDSISRQIPGVLGKNESLEEKRFGIGVPVYTRPETFFCKKKKYAAPKVLISGNHKKIDEWRRSKIDKIRK